MSVSTRINNRSGHLVAVMVTALLTIPAANVVASGDAAHGEEASHVEPVAGTNLKKVSLSEKAAERLDIKTTTTSMGATGTLTAPYAAVLYDKNGATWVYSETGPRTFVRAPIKIDSIADDVAYLKSGPTPGTKIVVVGAAELYGAELGVGH